MSGRQQNWRQCCRLFLWYLLLGHLGHLNVCILSATLVHLDPHGANDKFSTNWDDMDYSGTMYLKQYNVRCSYTYVDEAALAGPQLPGGGGGGQRRYQDQRTGHQGSLQVTANALIDLHSSYIYRVQSSVLRLPNYWPPTPSPPSECVLLPPHQWRAVWGWGSIFWKTPDIGLASWSIVPLHSFKSVFALLEHNHGLCMHWCRHETLLTELASVFRTREQPDQPAQPSKQEQQ